MLAMRKQLRGSAIWTLGAAMLGLLSASAGATVDPGEVLGERKIDSYDATSPAPGGGSFGAAVEVLGDLDGNGIADVAVGAPGSPGGGAVWVLFLDDSLGIKAKHKIGHSAGGFTGALADGDRFGQSVAAIGDLDGDGISEIAVGAPRDDAGGSANSDRGAIWILFLEEHGLVKKQQKIGFENGGFPDNLDEQDNFGTSVRGLGDLNGDGTVDLIVGAPGDDDGRANRGAIWVIFVRPDGTVLSVQKSSSATGNFGGPTIVGRDIGVSLSNIGDWNRDGITDVAVGVGEDGPSRSVRFDAPGAVWLLFLNRNGTVKAERKIEDPSPPWDGDLVKLFGWAVTTVGDLDDDGLPELAVGAMSDNDGGVCTCSSVGAVWMFFLNADGSEKHSEKISSNWGNFMGHLNDTDAFGGSVVGLGDINGDGAPDIAVGAPGGTGALWMLLLAKAGSQLTTTTTRSSTTTSSVVLASTTTTTAPVSVPCSTVSCFIRSVLSDSACAGVPVPAAIKKKLQQVEALTAKAAEAKGKARTKFQLKSRRALTMVNRNAKRFSRGRHPKLDPGCAAAMQSAIAAAQGALAAGRF